MNSQVFTASTYKPKREDLLFEIFEISKKLTNTKWYQEERGRYFEELKYLIEEYETILKGEMTKRDIKRQQKELERLIK